MLTFLSASAARAPLSVGAATEPAWGCSEISCDAAKVIRAGMKARKEKVFKRWEYGLAYIYTSYRRDDAIVITGSTAMRRGR